MNIKTRVVVADESPFVCRLLKDYLETSGEFEVVYTANNGARTVEKVKEHKPDLVTMGLEMPQMDGLEALGKIMRECPTPVVVVSGATGKSAARTMQALDFGAVDFVLKYAPGTNADPDNLRREIVAKARAARQVAPESLLTAGARPAMKKSLLSVNEMDPGCGAGSGFESVVVVAASTGGPTALRELLAELPEDVPDVYLIVQQIAPSFTGVLAAQLNRYSRLEVREARDGERLRAGVALVVPGGFHLILTPGDAVQLRPGQPGETPCPSADVTMESAARIFGARAGGIVLSGVGSDGCRGLAAIRARAGFTLAQEPSSAVMSELPRAAVELGLAACVGTPRRLASILVDRAAAQGERQHATGK